MNASKKITARIGVVDYINTAPIHETWKQSVVREEWEIVEAAPTRLNRKLANGELDLGFISSFEYGAHPEKYKILSGLSISANGPVGSVFLFSHVPLDQLDRAPVLLTSQSETSVGLVKIIFEEFNSVTPSYTFGDVTGEVGDEFKAVLAIGDDALRLVAESTYLYQFDLGDIWKRETGLPFVFAVCAVREEFCIEHQEVLDEIHREFIRCRDEGKTALKEVCEITASRIPMPVSSCYEYLQGIEYDLGDLKQKALTTYFEFLIRRGDIVENCLPLKIYSNLF